MHFHSFVSLNRAIAAAAIAFLIGLAPPAAAHEYALGALEIIHPWARASIGKARSGAAYLAIANNGATADRLVGARTQIAKKAGLHRSVMENGVMKMRPVEGIEIAPGETVVLEPGGFHVMLMGLKTPLVEGTRFPMTLIFEKAGSIAVEVTVQKAAAMKAEHSAD